MLCPSINNIFSLKFPVLLLYIQLTEDNQNRKYTQGYDIEMLYYRR